MNDYKPNSHRVKAVQAEERKVEKVVHGSVKAKKKNGLHSLASVFISEDVQNVKSYILMDVVVPTVKKAILGAVDMMLNGGSGSGYGRQTGPKVSYRQYYNDPRDDRYHREPMRARTPFDYEDIRFDTKGDAELMLTEMDNVIERYGFITVADMYDMAYLPQPHTSNKYGWTNISSADIVRTRDGDYIIKLPRALPID